MDNTSTPDPSPAAAGTDALERVAARVSVATRAANRAAGSDLFSPWLDVVAETVTAAGYLTDVREVAVRANPAGGSLSDADQVIEALQGAADILDAGPRDHRAVLVRAALTDALAAARRIRP